MQSIWRIALVTLLFSVPFRMTSQVNWVSTTNDHPWVQLQAKFARPSKTAADVTVLTEEPEQIIDGFGICFNELGWTALSVLEEQHREDILKNLFDPKEGLKLNICRMPIGANDYARNYYSLNDSVNSAWNMTS